jgi:uracil-DNA glycosylase
MREARLASEIDFAGWRTAARSLRLTGAPPDDVRWIVGGEANLFAQPACPSTPTAGAFTAPRAFLDLAADAILHRSPQRFDRLYRLLCRLKDEPGLMEMAGDPDVVAAADMARAVHRAAHKMKAFVRFREVAATDGEAFVAWFEPPHRVTERTAPFFAGRFANQAFSILTPDVCAHWDRETLSFSPGADRAAAPSDDALEDYWRTYYASIFNPARLKTKTMQREMPKRYWRNLPEAALIPALIEAAEARTASMVAAPTTEPRRPSPVRPAVPTPAAGSLAEIAAGVAACRQCGLWRDATQGVSADGPATARVMLVGEQPGDQEDLAGRPFVGPAGQMLDRALAAAGADRGHLVVTNAVRHFKHELRGKRRLHKTPNAGEVEACRWWLDAERAAVRPRVVVALGATAALAVFGRQIPIKPNRGKPMPLEDGAQGLVTYHPSFLLRLNDPAATADAFAQLVDDLRQAIALAA